MGLHPKPFWQRVESDKGLPLVPLTFPSGYGRTEQTDSDGEESWEDTGPQDLGTMPYNTSAIC